MKIKQTFITNSINHSPLLMTCAKSILTPKNSCFSFSVSYIFVQIAGTIDIILPETPQYFTVSNLQNKLS